MPNFSSVLELSGFGLHAVAELNIVALVAEVLGVLNQRFLLIILSGVRAAIWKWTITRNASKTRS